MKLLDRVRDVGLRRHLSPLTIGCYPRWADAFLNYSADRRATRAAWLGAGVGGDARPTRG